MKDWQVFLLIIVGVMSLWCAACGMGLALNSEEERLPNKISTTPSP